MTPEEVMKHHNGQVVGGRIQARVKNKAVIIARPGAEGFEFTPEGQLLANELRKKAKAEAPAPKAPAKKSTTSTKSRKAS